MNAEETILTHSRESGEDATRLKTWSGKKMLQKKKGERRGQTNEPTERKEKKTRRESLLSNNDVFADQTDPSRPAIEEKGGTENQHEKRARHRISKKRLEGE